MARSRSASRVRGIGGILHADEPGATADNANRDIGDKANLFAGVLDVETLPRLRARGDGSTRPPGRSVKACPSCGQQIQDAAIKCKHCQAMLGVLPRQDGAAGAAVAFKLMAALVMAACVPVSLLRYITANGGTFGDIDRMIGVVVLVGGAGVAAVLGVGAAVVESLTELRTVVDEHLKHRGSA